MKQYEKLEKNWNENLKVPFIKIEIHSGKRLGRSEKYIVFSQQTGYRIADANTLNDLNLNLNNFFSI